MPTIYDHWRRIITTVDEPTVIECGVHDGTSTINLRACVTAAGKQMRWLGLEPDPRNAKRCRELGIEVFEAAASDQPGYATLFLSSGVTPGYTERLHTDSSSLQKPTAHLTRFPWCSFAESVLVQTARLDDLVSPDERITLLWADVQGAQRKLLAGAERMLKQTGFLYIECSREPMYEGEPTFGELCSLLPSWRVVERWEDDVLFENTEVLG